MSKKYQRPNFSLADIVWQQANLPAKKSANFAPQNLWCHFQFGSRHFCQLKKKVQIYLSQICLSRFCSYYKTTSTKRLLQNGLQNDYKHE
jgi:hypothetical protein